jgi:cell division protein FtsW
MVISASIGQSFVDGQNYLEKEGLFICAGLCAMGLGAWLKYETWKRFSTAIAAGTGLLLVLVLMPHIGASSNGAQRWFSFHGWDFEPSEMAKIALAIYFAHWLSKKGDRIRGWLACTFPFGLMLGIVCILILKQPDMGTAVVLALSMVVVYFVAGAQIQHLLAGIVGGLAMAAIGVGAEGYRMNRIRVWEDPFKYAKGPGYHIVQVLIALGRGGLFGVGPGNSQQKFLLPAPSTDSIFAVTAEELGFIGATLIIGLFVLLAYRGIKIAVDAPDDFGRLLAVAITTTIVLQAFVNIAVITNTVPFTGVPLPFISYGGSSLIVCMFSVGILLNISRESRRRVRPPKPDSDTEGRPKDAHRHHRRQDRRPRLSGTGGRRVPAPALVHSQSVGGPTRGARHYG